MPPLHTRSAVASFLVRTSASRGGATAKIVVLGGGRVGNAIVRDLAAEEDFSVLVVDVDPVAVERLTEHGADGVVADLSDPETVSQAVADADLVVSAVPGFMGYSTVERVLQEGHPSSGYLLLPRRRVRPGRAREGGRRPVPRGLWVAPGLSNMVLGLTRRALRRDLQLPLSRRDTLRGAGVAVGVQDPLQPRRRDSDLHAASPPTPPPGSRSRYPHSLRSSWSSSRGSAPSRPSTRTACTRCSERAKRPRWSKIPCAIRDTPRKCRCSAKPDYSPPITSSSHPAMLVSPVPCASISEVGEAAPREVKYEYRRDLPSNSCRSTVSDTAEASWRSPRCRA